MAVGTETVTARCSAALMSGGVFTLCGRPTSRLRGLIGDGAPRWLPSIHLDTLTVTVDLAGREFVQLESCISAPEASSSTPTSDCSSSERTCKSWIIHRSFKLLLFVPLHAVSQFGRPESSAHLAASGARRSQPQLRLSAPPRWREASWTTLDTFHGYLGRSGKSLGKGELKGFHIWGRGENHCSFSCKRQECGINGIRKSADWKMKTLKLSDTE